ncbi:glutaredoxin family protein [Nocardia transvalensis]|uniref:glutaredoxin family protein n=1 Tax=Nocardia transvalensis TaxID=37333 RepID=UPI001893F649|nr:glutaredoxin domain-containing protein [Nocardia transvalensis]MBF6329768.1 NrdH-redoxin [Nocardia transvalensis]
MTDSSPDAPPVTVYWRWWCTYCLRLGIAMRRAGIAFDKIDITRDPAAAADLRALTGGDEITPTVLVNGHTLINPKVDDIRAALADSA